MKRFMRFISVFLIIIPLLIIAVWSFFSNWRWPDLLPSGLTLRGYEYTFGPSGNAGMVLLTSILISFAVTVLTLLICFPAARALTFYNFRGKKLINGIILLPALVPALSVALGIHLTFLKAGLAGTVLGVILIQIIPGIPYAVTLLSDSFRVNGNKNELQAKTLGATPFQTLFHITLPLNAPGIEASGTMVFIVSYSQYFITLLIGSGKIKTFPLLMMPFLQNSDRTIASAMAVVFLSTLWFITFLLERFILHSYQSYRKLKEGR